MLPWRAIEMAKRKIHHGPQTATRQQDKSAQPYLAATGILMASTLAAFISLRYSPHQELAPAKTDLYSNYRWGNCDTHPGQCSREYSTSDTATLTRHRPCLNGLECPCSEVKDGINIIYTFPNFNKHCQYRRYVGLGEKRAEYVYGRVAQEYDDLVKAGIDPLRLERVVLSLSQMSSGNIGELVALKRPDLESRYWDEMKAFVQHNPKSAPPKKVQDLFKKWYGKDPTILPRKTKSSELPVIGDFKWTISKHSQLEFGQRYNSGPFFVGGYPWKLIYYPQSDWDHTQFAIYLTPVGSQASRPGWLRQVSFNVRVHGHDSPSQSIWANWNHTYSPFDEDVASGFSHFKDNEILHMPGRGYLKSDTLEIRAIVRMDAAANMGPVKNTASQGFDLAGLAGGVQGFLGDAFRPASDRKPFALLLREFSMQSLAGAAWDLQKHAEALWSWFLCLPELVTRPELYLTHLKFILTALGLAFILSFLRKLLVVMCKEASEDPEEADSKGVFSFKDILLSHQLVIFSIASRAVLTHQTALALVAHVLSSGDSPTRAPEASRKAVSLSNTLRFLHLLGLAIAVDMLVSGWEIKLLLPAILGMLLELKMTPLHESLDGALCVAFMLAMLLDCLLHQMSAAFMQGPLIRFLTAGEIELWPEVDLLPHCKPAKESLHANTCMALFFMAAMFTIYPRIRPASASLIGMLLFLGARWVLSFLWMAMYAWGAGLPEHLPEGHSWSQLAVDILIHVPANNALQNWKHAGHCLKLCLRALSSVLVQTPLTKGQDRVARKGGTSAKEETTDGGKSGCPSGGKVKSPGSKGGAQKRSKVKPEAKKATQGGATQLQKRSAGQKSADMVQKPADIFCKPIDVAATIQLSPATPVHASPAEHFSKAIEEQYSTETTPPKAEKQRAVQATFKEGSKSKSGKLKAFRSAEAASTQTVPRSNSSSLSGRASSASDQPDRNASDSALLDSAQLNRHAQDSVAVDAAHLSRSALQAASADAASMTEGAVSAEPVTQTNTPELTLHKASLKEWDTDDQPSKNWPAPIRLGASSPRLGTADLAPSRPPPMESLLPVAGPQQHSVKDASAEDLLLALLKASPSATDSRPSSAAQSQPSSALQPLAREASSTLRDALPHPAAAANSNSVRAQQVPGKGREAQEEQSCIMCWEKPRQSTLAPCGHRALCPACTELLLMRGNAQCPICRRVVQSYILREFDV